MPRHDDREPRDDPYDRDRRRSWDDDRDRWDERDSRGRFPDADDYVRRRYDDFDGYDSLPRRDERPSSLGLWSFLISIATGGVLLLVIGAAVVMTIDPTVNLTEDSPEAMILGLGMLGGLGVAVIGLVLGFRGLAAPNTGKVLAILGIVFNGLILLGTLGLMVIGIAVS